MIRRQCTKTGLSIVEGPVTMFRVSVSKAGRGPLNPLERPFDPAIDRRGWSRFDTPGLTIYGADLRVTAFTESLAFKAPSARNYAALAEIAGFLGVELNELLDELRNKGLPVDGMDSDWRLDREIYSLSFPTLPWVDLTHPDSVVAIKASGIAAADRMTVADLTGDDRTLTTAVAQWILAQRLDDGSQPAGLRYPSKFGFTDGDYCYAGFIAEPNSGCECRGSAFAVNDPDLIEAVRRTGVQVS
ncbi:RES domain-containing protein [Arthrobacter sp. MMS18-M83]|uniref:RES domain-containing protein n=1 Tax=Arthrobacter sp. MMS18-M83 TaxID=2996261 RepID=UPI00227AC7D8|nr:RES domain-containing protein [Arthrobacter sp. MMS18-M83]WAH95589.1 RES domain-containing protein [Arthrobacter sp. MMS18-M83]